MDDNILKMCKENCEGTPMGACSSVHYGNQYRFNKAKEEAAKASVDVDIIINYVNEFYKKLGINSCKNPRKDNPVINQDFYKNLQNEYELEKPCDIIWMIFTKDGYLGLVALSNDINFDIAKNENEYLITDKNNPNYHYTKGILVHSLGKEWDESFVLVFPLKNLPQGIERHDVERGIGNYLISKGVPIIDYYSHNY